MLVSEDNWLAHVGTPQEYDFDPHGSGRYRQGSGESPYQHAKTFRDRVAKIRRDHLAKTGSRITDKELIRYLVDEGYGDKNGTLTIRDFRKMVTKAKAEVEAEDYRRAKVLKEERQWSDKAIAEELGISESGVRNLLKRDAEAKERRINSAAEILKESLDTRGGYIDIGAYSEMYLGVGRSNLEAAVKQLKDEGYVVINGSVRQVFGQGNTTVQVLCPPGTTKGDVFNHFEDIRLPVDIHVDADGNGKGVRPIENISSKRIQVKYAEEGGIDKDGVIELRRGVSDLDLGNSHYAQVRIGVDGTHYLKGMAVYADDLPDGIDIRFNTNKHLGTPLIATEPGGKEVLKPMQDPKNLTNPFGASIKADNGQRGALNIVNEEGDWSKWSKTLSSQFLSKQYEQTAKRQLKATADISKSEFEEIKSLTNPTLKRYLLQEFADSCDADAVHLKAVRLPGQTQKVLLPIPENNPRKCYCPSLEDGTEVALIRYPHGGVFEIPKVIVDNNNPSAKKIFGNAQDAIGIHPSVAGVLSGADFDGDTVMVLPITRPNGTPIVRIKTKPQLEGLKGFEPKEMYNGDNMPARDRMKKGRVQTEMGMISNLITDMTIRGADDAELARAVRHSMVVIDAYKHKLNYKASARDNRIEELKQKYQNGGGASTVISAAKGEKNAWFNDRREKAVSKLTPEERERWERGEIIWEPTGKMVYNKETGLYDKPKRNKTSNMYETSDAYTLSSGTTIEKYYADYANTMKSLANQARAELRHTDRMVYSPSAKKAYEKEVASLNKKLKTAQMNAPLERKAQTLANSTLRVEFADHPEYDDGQKKKAKSRHLEAARNAVGAGKKKIDISDREWEAIQAGALHDSKALDIFKNADSSKLRQRAMPRGTSIAPAKIARAKNMISSNDYTWAEVAEILGVSVSGLQKALG